MPTPLAAIGATQPSQVHGSVDQAMTALGGMDSEGFLKLLVAQLQYQSPLEPSDPGDLMTQTSALAQLDATQQLLGVQQRGIGLQQAVLAAGLMGQSVVADGVDGAPVAGEVAGIRYTADGPVLEVEGRDVRLGDVREVRRPMSPPPPSDPPLET